MHCLNCELNQKQFFCGRCLRDHLRDLRQSIQLVAGERQEHIQKGKRALSGMERPRRERSHASRLATRISELQTELQELHERNNRTLLRVAELRNSISQRQSHLRVSQDSLQGSNGEEFLVWTKHSNDLASALSRARTGLVQELVEVFDVVEVGGRPPMGGKAGTKGEWTIGGIILPVPGDIRRYPPVQMNAVITHTIHFIGLLTLYLGIKLPFEVTWAQNALGVGMPWISASKGSEHGGWVKWTGKHPLHLSSSAAQVPPAPTDGSSEAQSFNTAFTMLLFNAAYLAFTQSIDIPLSQTGEVLRNLWTVCCSADLGRNSHQTKSGPSQRSLPPPTPPSFILDFTQLLQVMTANPLSRHRSRRKAIGSGKQTSADQPIPEEDEWDLVDDMNAV